MKSQTMSPPHQFSIIQPARWITTMQHALQVLALLLALSWCAPQARAATMFSGKLGSNSTTFPGTSGTQTGGVNSDNTASTCAAPKAFPGLASATGSRAYDAYTFTNPSTTTDACVMVTYTLTGTVGATDIFAVAYLGSFDPANVNQNYLADAGKILSASGAMQTFSFTLPAGQTAVLVIHAFNPMTSVGATYKVAVSGLPETLVVTSTADPGDGTCDLAGVGDGCTLREAITAANTNANPGFADNISFDIPGPNVQTITLTSDLPDITEAVNIDGYTQPGASANTLAQGDDAVLQIEINGDGDYDGFNLRTDNSVIRGLVINRIDGNAIVLSGSNNRVEGCFIGTNAAGTEGNSFLLSGNQSTGVAIVGSGSSLTVANNLIGGTAPAARNIISGNFYGVAIETFLGANNRVQGNYIGTDKTGTVAVGNFLGVGLGSGSDVVIGGLNAGEGNLISGNNGSFNGVPVFPGAGIAFGDFLGGGGGSLVSNCAIQGNLIGTDVTGTLPLGNGVGVLVNSSSPFVVNNIIGGTAAGAGNTIAFNLGNGISISVGTGIQITRNRIYQNGSELSPALGINLVGGTEDVNGVTANDFRDTDSGANNLQNYPVLADVVQNSLTGTFNSTPNRNFRLDFYANDAPDASGFGEGQTYLGSQNVGTDFLGDSSFSYSLNGVANNQFISATATDLLTNDTSEFSNALPVQFAGSLQFSAANYSIGEGGGSATITVTRSGGGSAPVSVKYGTIDGTAKEDSDYVRTRGTLNFAAGQNSATFTVPITDDTSVENDETVVVQIGDASSGATFGTNKAATLTIVDNDTNAPGTAKPVADNQSRTTPKNTPIQLTLTGTDSDTPQAGLTFQVVDGPQKGTLLGTAPNLVYSPFSEATGADSFTFTISDGTNKSNLATVSLQVLAGNTPPPSDTQAPVAQTQVLSTDFNTPLAIVLSATDADTPVANLTYRLVTSPAHGTLGGNASNLTYTPNNNFSGSDAFSFVANDGTSDSATATVSITVRPANAPPTQPSNAPVAVDDNYTLIYGPASQAQAPDVTLLTTGVFQISAPGVLANDRDASGNVLSVHLMSNAKNGRLQIRSDGSFFYLPSTGFVGNDEFTYKVSNGLGSSTAKVRVKVIDRLAPELRFDTPANGATVKTISEIKGRVRDRNSGLKSLTLVWRRFDGKFWNGSAWVAALTELPLKVDGINWSYEGIDAATPLLSGAYALRVTATDNSGNISRVTNNVTVGSSAPAAPVSTVRLSSAGASAEQGVIVLRFTGALNAAAVTNLAHYAVMAGDGSVKIADAAYGENTVTLSGLELSAGDELELKISGLLDATGKTLQDGTIKLIAR